VNDDGVFHFQIGVL